MTDLFETEKQKFSPSNLVTMFDLDLTTIIGGVGVLQFTSTAFESEAVVWQGNMYTPIPIEADGFEISSSGSLPAPTLRVLNTTSLQSSVIALNDLLGATLTRTRTFKTFLDDGATPDPTAYFPQDVFKVDRKISQNKVFIEWELAASIDQEGRMIPGRQIIRDYCTHIYRRYDTDTADFNYDQATCPYTGGLFFDENNVPCAASADRCGKRLSSCRARFGTTVELPTRAFPGVAKIR